MSEFISVIVPVYNVENYLERCIKSILNQTYKHLEIILINDGSTDSSGKICDKYVKLDKRIKAIHKDNEGLSSARNLGLDIAQGKYISFIDSDDEIMPTMYESLLNNMHKYEAAISVGGVVEVYPEYEVESSTNCSYNIECLDKKSAMKYHLLRSWAVWDKIYKSEIFLDIRFPYGKINEDEAIMLEILNKSDKVVYTNQIFYRYYRRPNSITTAAFDIRKFDWLENCINNLNFLQHNYPDLVQYAEYRKIMCLLWLFENILLEKNEKFIKREKFIINYLKEDINNILKNKYIQINIKFQVLLIILNKKIYIYLKEIRNKFISNENISLNERIKNKLEWYKNDIIDLFNRIFLETPKILTVDQTIDYILNNNASVSRFGDGEFVLIEGKGLGFQECDIKLSTKLGEVLASNENGHIICLPDIFGDLSQYKSGVQLYWKSILFKHRKKIYKMIDRNKVYYNAFLSRPYHMFKDKSNSLQKFNSLSRIWDKRDVLIIEGSKTRFGVGNNLLDNANSIIRIICPAENAFEKYDEIINAVTDLSTNCLILIALGPTATVLAYDLFKLGYQAIDIGHVDIEYEWFLQQSEEKIPLAYKYVNEVPNGHLIGDNFLDEIYELQIKKRII